MAPCKDQFSVIAFLLFDFTFFISKKKHFFSVAVGHVVTRTMHDCRFEPDKLVGWRDDRGTQSVARPLVFVIITAGPSCRHTKVVQGVKL